MRFLDVETPLGTLDIEIYYYPKEVKEKKYNEEPKDEITATLQTLDRVGEQPANLMINGIPCRFRLTLELSSFGDGPKWHWNNFFGYRYDHSPFGEELTNGAMKKIQSLVSWFPMWFANYKPENVLRICKNESLIYNARKKVEEAKELREKAAKCEKQAHYYLDIVEGE